MRRGKWASEGRTSSLQLAEQGCKTSGAKAQPGPCLEGELGLDQSLLCFPASISTYSSGQAQLQDLKESGQVQRCSQHASLWGTRKEPGQEFLGSLRLE